jgi:phosphonate transport system permease protein
MSAAMGPDGPHSLNDAGAQSGVQAVPTAQVIRRTARAAVSLGLALGLLVLIVWSFVGVGFDPMFLVSHFKQGVSTARQFWPPDWSILWTEIWSMVVTIQMAIVGTLVGAVLAVPLSFFAARTTSLLRGLSSVIKTVMNIFRATPIVIYAIILTAMLGLGQMTGAIAIGVGTFVMLTKLYAEALESVSPGPVEAVRASGGSAAQVCVFGMLPQVFPSYIATTLYAFELNLQASFILGFVGAGGIGYELLNYTREFRWQCVSTILIITIVVVNLVDFVSYRVRSSLS